MSFVKAEGPSRTTWKLKEWNAKMGDPALPPMTQDEIEEAVAWLRGKNYPAPADCPDKDCEVCRPACSLGVCRIAVGMCGDF